MQELKEAEQEELLRRSIEKAQLIASMKRERVVVRCDTCQWWWYDGGVENKGECRCVQPTAECFGKPHFPLTNDNEWCGIWERIDPNVTHEAES